MGGTLEAFGCHCLGNRVVHVGALLVLYVVTLWMLLLVDLRSFYTSSEQIYTLRGGGWLRADVYAACSVGVVGLS